MFFFNNDKSVAMFDECFNHLVQAFWLTFQWLDAFVDVSNLLSYDFMSLRPSLLSFIYAEALFGVLRVIHRC